MAYNSQIEVEKPTDVLLTTSQPYVEDTSNGHKFDIVSEPDEPAPAAPMQPKAFNLDTFDDDRYKEDKKESFDAFLNPRKTMKKEDEVAPEPLPTMKRSGSESPARSATRYRSRESSRGRSGYGYGNLNNYFEEKKIEDAKQLVGAFTATVPSDEVPEPMEIPEELMSPVQLAREKGRLLNEYREMNTNYLYNPTELSMESSLQDIRTNLFLVKDQKQRLQGRKLVKKIMTVGASTVVGISNQYELFGVDMTDWLKLFNHEVNTQGDYDDMIDELVTKYKQKMTMPVELKLAITIATSFGTAVLNKREEVKVLREMKMEMEKERQDRERAARETLETAAMLEHLRRQQSNMQVPMQVPSFVQQQQQQMLRPPTFSPEDVRAMLKNNDQFMDESEYQPSESGMAVKEVSASDAKEVILPKIPSEADPHMIPLPEQVDETTIGATETAVEKPKRKGRPPTKKKKDVEVREITVPTLP